MASIDDYLKAKLNQFTSSFSKRPLVGGLVGQGINYVQQQAPQIQRVAQQQFAPTIQTARMVAPVAKAYGNIIGQGITSWQKTTPHGMAIQQLSQNLPQSSPNKYANTYLKAIAPFRKPTDLQDVGNIASAAWGAPQVASNLIGGGINYGINKFTKQQSDADAIQSGIEFSSKIGGVSKLLATPLAGLVKQLNPTATKSIGDLMDKGKTGQAFSQLWKNVRTKAITGGIEGGVYGSTLPAKDAKAWVKNVFDNTTQFAAFSGGTEGVKGLGTIGFKGGVKGLKAIGGKINDSLKQGMDNPNLQEVNASVKGNVLHGGDITEIRDMKIRSQNQWKANDKVNLDQMGKDEALVDTILQNKYGAKASELKKMELTEKIDTLYQIAAEDFRQNPSIKLGEAESSVKLPKPAKTNKQVAEQATLPVSKPQRGFAETVANTADTPPQVREDVLASKRSYYDPTTNDQTVSYVKDNILSKGEDYALGVARSRTNVNANATSQLLIQKYLKAGDYEKASALIKEVTPRFTKQGQQIQILSLYGRLTPTGATRFAQSIIDEANASRPKGKQLVLTPEMTRSISQYAENIKGLPEGSREKVIATAQLMKEISSVVPPSLGQKISTIQTMAQLLNPKTAIRNTLGNAIFSGFENVSDVLGTGVDKATSVVTGQRTKVLPSLSAQGAGIKRGFKEGVQDAKLGIDTSGGVSSQYDLPSTTFKTGFLGKAEKVLNIELRATDRAAFTAAYEGSLNNQMRAAGVSKPTDAMIEIAHNDGLYRTFQDNSKLAEVFSGGKKLANKIGTPDGKFGLGDLILKYPKTPANLLSRGLDYSPAGFLKGVWEATKPLLKGSEFNQKKFVEDISRGVVGTGLLATGYMLAKNGIITGKPEKDKDIASLQRNTGTGGFRINVDALKRFVSKGGSQNDKDGDTTVSYDWAQPISLALGMGANFFIKPKGQDAFTAAIEQLDAGTSTLTQQSLVKGVTDFAGDVKQSGPVRALTNAVLGAPSGFVPSILNQGVQLSDNKSRETYDPNAIVQAFNKVKARIPGVEATLPQSVNTLGQEQERYQGGSNNVYNVLFNPAFVGTIKQNPSAKEVLDIYDRSGQTQQAPRLVDRNVKINDQDTVLSPEQYTKYQKYVGTRADQAITTLSQDPLFKELGDEDKAQKIANVLGDINSAAKIELFGNQPKSVGTNVKQMVSGNSNISSSIYGYGKYLGEPPVTGLEKYDWADKKLSEAVSLYNDSNVPQKAKQEMLAKYGYNSADLQYEASTRLSNKVVSGYLGDSLQGKTQEEIYQTLVQGRKESMGGNLLVTNGVLDSLAEKGVISEADAKYLKKVKFNSSGQSTAKAPKAKKVKVQKLKKVPMAKFKAFKSPKLKASKQIKFTKIKKAKIKNYSLKSLKVKG